MIRIEICDDDSRARDALRWSLERQLDADGEQIIYDFSSGEGVVQWLKKHPGQMNLLFLDVEKVMVVLERQKIGFYGKLDELEARLGRGFVRIHQRYLVRAAAVDYIGTDAVRIQGQSLPAG